MSSSSTVFEQSPPVAGPDAAQRDDLAQLGIWMFLATLVMLFAAFTSAYIVRRSASDWTPIELPWIVWTNTAVLIASSAMLESARRAARHGAATAARLRLATTAGLGAIFLAGQVVTWRTLIARGVYVATSPHSSFAYVLTSVHGIHVVAGLALLVYGVMRSRHVDPAARARLMTVSVTFWHFLAVMWVYVLVLVSVF
jgi:cytochrome c oxidase subunit 3